MATPLNQWFTNLESIRTCLRNLDHQTQSDLRSFSHQTLKELRLDSTPEGQLRQGTLCQHCATTGIGACPPNSFSEPARNFRWFLDNFGGLVVERLLAECLRIAWTLTPPYPGTTADGLRPYPLGEVFRNASERQMLDAELALQVPASFYRAAVRASAPGSEALTMEAFCERVLS